MYKCLDILWNSRNAPFHPFTSSWTHQNLVLHSNNKPSGSVIFSWCNFSWRFQTQSGWTCKSTFWIIIKLSASLELFSDCVLPVEIWVLGKGDEIVTSWIISTNELLNLTLRQITWSLKRFQTGNVARKSCTKTDLYSTKLFIKSRRRYNPYLPYHNETFKDKGLFISAYSGFFKP